MVINVAFMHSIWCTLFVLSMMSILIATATEFPSSQPSLKPTSFPSSSPTAQPSSYPTSSYPSSLPTSHPTSTPTYRPTAQPTSQPSAVPTLQPAAVPTSSPSAQPSSSPTAQPTSSPTEEGVTLDVEQKIVGVSCDMIDDIKLYQTVLKAAIAEFSVEVNTTEVFITKFCDRNDFHEENSDNIMGIIGLTLHRIQGQLISSKLEPRDASIQSRYTVRDYESSFSFDDLAHELARYVNNDVFTDHLQSAARKAGAKAFYEASSTEVKIKGFDGGSDGGSDEDDGGDGDGGSDGENDAIGDSDGARLTAGEIAGVVIASLAGVALFGLVCYYSRKYREEDAPGSGEYETVRLTSNQA